MTIGTSFLIVLVLLVSLAWYGLQVHALRDLRRRPRVRGDNKVLWALLILCLPFGGALIYLSAGPTSFIARPDARTTRPGIRPRSLEPRPRPPRDPHR